MKKQRLFFAAEDVELMHLHLQRRLPAVSPPGPKGSDMMVEPKRDDIGSQAPRNHRGCCTNGRPGIATPNRACSNC